MDECIGCHDLNDLKNNTLTSVDKKKTMVKNPVLHYQCFECGKIFKFVKDKDGMFVEKK